jgi:hypothetical protein
MHGGLEIGWEGGGRQVLQTREAWKNPKSLGLGQIWGRARGSDQARRGKLAFAGTSPTVGS